MVKPKSSQNTLLSDDFFINCSYNVAFFVKVTDYIYSKNKLKYLINGSALWCNPIKRSAFRGGYGWRNLYILLGDMRKNIL